jgi:hypothetical protein
MNLFLRLLSAAAIMMPIGGHANTGGKQMEAKGTFEVKVAPAEPTAFEKAMGLGRYEVVKDWSGDFAGTSRGEMLTTFTESTGAMAYTAMEQVTGRLGGKSGTFYLAHRATMTKGETSSGEINIVIVKGSGTGELAGISGGLTIVIDASGRHSYVLEYELP